jgi:Icc-related predicted phosphoesterase
LGAIADAHGAAAATLANVERAARAFAAAHVDAVLVLGDVGEREDEIAAVLDRLRAANAPVYALPGEMEDVGAFHEAAKRAHAIDFVDERAVEIRGVRVAAVPGYAFAKDGFRYGDDDLERVRAARADVVALHAPPKGRGERAGDWAIGGVNAGDPALTELLDDVKPKAALFAHVDEAGGRADRLGVNVGSIADGMAALVELDGGAARTRVLR